MSQRQPTNKPTVEQSDVESAECERYLSVRVTMSHGEWDHLANNVFHDVDWLVYKHGGANGKQEHFHVCVPGANPERIRKRLRDHVGGGAKCYSVKQFYNGYSSFVFYCEHEGSVPIFKSEECIKWSEIIADVKAEGVYAKQRVDDYMVHTKEVRIKDRDWQLTYSNLVCQAVHWRNKHLKGCESLKAVVKHMMKHTKWRPSKDMYRGGVPDVYQQDFEVRIGVRAEHDMDWWTPRQF